MRLRPAGRNVLGPLVLLAGLAAGAAWSRAGGPGGPPAARFSSSRGELAGDARLPFAVRPSTRHAGRALAPLAADSLTGRWVDGPRLPRPLTNNAVAAVTELDGTGHLFSFLGLAASKRYTGIVRDAYGLAPEEGRWRSLPPVPGPDGRLAATAQGLGGRVYLFGGYTVDAEGEERSLPNVQVFDPATNRWSERAPIPVPVDDAVSGVWRDSLIFLVSGWSQRDNVANVQVYDPASDRWRQATRIPGPPVFGHAGGIIGDVVVYCDGVTVDRSRRPAFGITNRCFRGEIEPENAAVVHWAEIPAHPGAPVYRAAAGPLPGRGLLVFAGGTSNPYNYDGIGYDGRPSAPAARTFAYEAATGAWLRGPPVPVPSMDHRGLVRVGSELWSIGGMEEGQRVTARVRRLLLDAAAPAKELPSRR